MFDQDDTCREPMTPEQEADCRTELAFERLREEEVESVHDGIMREHAERTRLWQAELAAMAPEQRARYEAAVATYKAEIPF